MKKRYELSSPERIQLVRDMLVVWLKTNDIELYELSRAEALLMKESCEKRKQEALERRSH